MNLHGGAPYWLVLNGMHTAVDPLPRDVDVVVVGAGISGALIADRLSADGHAVAVVDRRTIAEGSTAASTALLMYGLDVELNELSDAIGPDAAVRAYRRTAKAVASLGVLAQALDSDVGFRERDSLYLAVARRDPRRLQRETDLCRHASLDAEWIDADLLAREHGLHARGAILSRSAAEVDPVRLARALLRRVQQRGSTVSSHTTVTGLVPGEHDVQVETDRGVIRARWCVTAMGYATPPGLTPPIVTLHSSFAFVTEPLRALGSMDPGTVWWEASRPYLYARTTADRRLVVGGADLPFKDPDRRDAALPARRGRLETLLSRRLPDLEYEISDSWSGTFAETPDGLPCIGPMPDAPRVVLALCAGGNGIPFAQVAAEVVATHLGGDRDPDAELFDPSRQVENP